MTAISTTSQSTRRRTILLFIVYSTSTTDINKNYPYVYYLLNCLNHLRVKRKEKKVSEGKERKIMLAKERKKIKVIEGEEGKKNKVSERKKEKSRS